MCRTGGRRCPGCQGSSARAAHNARRRRNREIKAEILDLAAEQGAGGEVLAALRAGPPQQAKRWAAENGLPTGLRPGNGHLAHSPAERSELALHELPGHGAPAAGPPSGPVLPAPTWVDADWATAQLRDQIAAAREVTGGHRDERSLLAGVVVSSTSAHGGTNETSRVVLDNGMVGYHKPFDGVADDIASGFGQDSAQQQVHEVAAWVLARELGQPWQGLVPPVVVTEVGGRLGSLALERPGVQMRAPSDVAAEDRSAAAFFDALIGQQDRHPNNYLVAGDRVTLIDHGYAFARSGDYLNFSFFQAARIRAVEDDPTATRLSAGEIDALDRFLASPTSWGLDGLLEPDRLAAMRSRAEAMRESGRLLEPGTYG